MAMKSPSSSTKVRMKFASGPAATVADRAQSGAPCMVWRRSDADSPLTSAPRTELASASPRNLT